MVLASVTCIMQLQREPLLNGPKKLAWVRKALSSMVINMLDSSVVIVARYWGSIVVLVLGLIC